MIRMKIYICSVVVVSVLSLTAGARRSAADIYQYIDEKGVVHFTNFPKERSAKLVKPQANAQTATARKSLPQSAPREQRNDLVPAAYLDHIDKSCEKFGVDPSLVRAIVKVESAYNPFAVSRKGAMGLMQLMPQTAEDMKVKNSFNPHENIEGGVKYLRYLLDRYEGNLTLALAAYNSGETAVKRWGTVPPFKETQDYVRKVLALYQGTGKTGTARYTIYVGMNPDGSLLLTDNPTNHPGKTLHRKMDRDL